MKYKYKLLALLVVALPLMGLLVTAAPTTVSAATPQECYDAYHNKNFKSDSEAAKEYFDSGCNTTGVCQYRDAGGGGGLGNILISCVDPNNPDNPCNPVTYDNEKCNQQRGVTDCDTAEGTEVGDCAAHTSFSFAACKNDEVGIQCLVDEVILFLSTAVGILVVAGVIRGGITYSTSQGNPAQVQKGMTIIGNSVLGLILYLLLFAIVSWLIPGGVIE